MRILHIINSLETAGAERLLVGMLPLMKQRGHEVHVAVINGTESDFSCQLKEEGITLFLLGTARDKYNPFVVWWLRKYICQYDLVHVHLFPAQYWAIIARLLWRSKAKFVTTEHNTFNSRCKYRLTTILDRWFYRHYDAIACISEATYAFMRERVSVAVPMRIIRNGIDLKRFRKVKGDRAQCLPSVPSDAFVMIQVARFQPQKNQACVIRAMTKLPSQIHAVFVGEGDTKENCKKLALSLGVTDRVHFLGVRSDVPELLSVSNIGVMSSVWEGFGLSAVECMAAGLPVLASRVEGLAQVVGDDRLLFDENNEFDLAEKVLSLYRDFDYSVQMARLCSQRADMFDVSGMVDSYLNFYGDVVNGNKI